MLQTIVTEYAIARIRGGAQFSADDLDYLGALSSRHTDKLVEVLSEEECLSLAGLLLARREELSRHLRQEISHHAE